jgi:glycerophosphoryl diester phosphodiesterase
MLVGPSVGEWAGWLLASALLVVGCAVQRQAVRPAPPFAAVVGPVIVAHRGGALEAPENTVAAIEHGVAAGADWQELDVTLTRDRKVVVIHDDTLERTTTGAGAVAEHTLEEIRALDAGAPRWSDSGAARLRTVGVTPPAFAGQYAGARVPTLDEVLAVPGVRLMIELKTVPERERLVDEVLAAIRRVGVSDQVALASFDAATLFIAHNRDPSLPLVGIAETEAGLEELLVLPLAVLAVTSEKVAPAPPAAPAATVDLVAVALDRVGPGTAVWAWTAYSVDEAVALRDRGVHGIITDAPAAVVAALRAEADPFLRPTQP